MKIKLPAVLLSVFILCLFVSCNKYDDSGNRYMRVKSLGATGVTKDQAQMNASIKGLINEDFFEYGFHFGKERFALDSVCKGVVSSRDIYRRMVDLEPNTDYYYRAYARNYEEIRLSDSIMHFKTKLGGIPEVINQIEMVLVEGGSFDRGKNDSILYYDEYPKHTVKLSSFYIGKYEVTQELYEAVMGKNPSGCVHPSCPVERVSYLDVNTFIDALNAITGENYRMLTEAEWEYAARGGSASNNYTYSGSNNADEIAWYKANADDFIQPVGTKQPNELGIYDMSGNVAEWVSDFYDKKYYRVSDTLNPTGPDKGKNRVTRGGSWIGTEEFLLPSFRIANSPSSKKSHIGFRLAKSIE